MLFQRKSEDPLYDYSLILRELIRYLIWVVSSFSLIVIYNLGSKLWVPYGSRVLNTDFHNFAIEVPLLIMIMGAFYFPKLGNCILKYTLPATLVLTMYIAFDVFYVFLDRTPRLSDIANGLLIYEFSPAMALGVGLLLFLVLFSVLLLLYKVFRHYTAHEIIVSLLVRVTVVILLFTASVTGTLSAYQSRAYEMSDWSQAKSIRTNGRGSSFLYYSSQEIDNFRRLSTVKKVDSFSELYSGAIVNRRNVHMIILESFIDPRLMRDLEFMNNPIAKEFEQIILDSGGLDFSHVVSPVYGGSTAQAEFELLAGVKALAKVNSIEFNVMQGGSISGFVNRLKQSGYKTVATIASASKYFNSVYAYKSLGFSEVHYLEDEEGINTNPNDDFIFDGDLFEWNKNILKKHLHESRKPVFNYVLGMYGHTPYGRNIVDRPDFVHASYKRKSVQRISEQFYYRTKALARYIGHLLITNPDSIIYISSDHLPPVIIDVEDYAFDKRTNISLLISGKTYVDVSGKSYFEIPWKIWDLLSNSDVDRNLGTSGMVDIYYSMLSESISLRPEY